MGGLWEAGVKSCKTLSHKSTSSIKYTFEELATLLSKVEACLNYRPISPMSEDKIRQAISNVASAGRRSI